MFLFDSSEKPNCTYILRYMREIDCIHWPEEDRFPSEEPRRRLEPFHFPLPPTGEPFFPDFDNC